ncbi:MAG TPA: response regulator [Planctomycetota bacterium]|jgi:DNA-binding response OmpR family regulator|nr:response regulator [Planctomycetota bacterium]
MPNETILLIEDERDIIEVIQYNFEKEGYRVLSATNGEKGLDIARSKRPAAVVLDLMLPGLDGLEVAKRLRNDPATREIAILMLTAKGEESDVILGLGVGADDYVTKPFKMKELLARIKAVLRRGPLQDDSPTGQRLDIGDLVIDKAKYVVTLKGKDVPLTLTEFKLLSILASAPGRVFTRELLLEKIQGEAFIDERNIDVHVRSVRKKLGDEFDYILTVRGVGYKFKD